MSSAILYLAIVAIWAFLLVPRWIRRPHASGAADGPAVANFEAPTSRSDPDLDDYAPPSHSSAHFSNGYQPSRSPSGIAPPAPSEAAPADPDADADTTPLPTAAPPAARPDAAPPVTAPPAGPRPARVPPPPLSRSKIIQARRRLLTSLVALAIAAAACTALRLASPWVCIPPVIMLALYVLLLREAATADTEHARHRAEAAAAARRRARARQAAATRAAQPSAEIIDISARLGDQLYDQYADATIRAVGD